MLTNNRKDKKIVEPSFDKETEAVEQVGPKFQEDDPVVQEEEVKEVPIAEEEEEAPVREEETTGLPSIEDTNGQLGQVMAMLQQMAKNQADIEDHIQEIERNQEESHDPSYIVAKNVYDTDRKHLPEYTVITPRMVDPMALSDTCAAMLNPLVLSGQVSLGEIRQESIYRHLRSLRGNLLEKASQHALSQEQNKAEDSVKPWNVGGGE